MVILFDCFQSVRQLPGSNNFCEFINIKISHESQIWPLFYYCCFSQAKKVTALGETNKQIT